MRRGGGTARQRLIRRGNVRPTARRVSSASGVRTVRFRQSRIEPGLPGRRYAKLGTGIRIAHVPYKGGPQAITDVIGRQVTMCFGAYLLLCPISNSGRVRALAITKSTCTPTCQPLQRRSRIRGRSVAGCLAPAHTPLQLIKKLNAAILQEKIAKSCW